MVNKKDYGHYIFLLCVGCTLFINYYFSNDVLSLLATVVSCIYIFTCKQAYYIPSAIFFSSYALLFRYGPYAIFVFVCLAILIRGILDNTKYITSILILFSTYAFFHLLSTFVNSVKSAIGDYIPLFSIMCLYVICINYLPSCKRDCIKHFLFGFYTSSVLGFFVENTRLSTILSVDYITVDSWQDTVRFFGLSYDCNFYVLSAALVLYFLLFEERFIFTSGKNAMWYIMLVATTILGMLTFSKSFVLALFLLLGFAVLLSSKSTKSKLMLFIPISVLFIVFSSNSLSELINIAFSRFDDAATFDDLTTGRSELWKIYYAKVFEDMSSFAIGYGIRGINMMASHNTYLEIASKFGVWGLTMEIIYLYACGRVLVYRGNHAMNNRFVCTILYLFLLFNLSAYTFYGLWVILFFVLISKQDYFESEVRNDQHYCSGVQC